MIIKNIISNGGLDRRDFLRGVVAGTALAASGIARAAAATAFPALPTGTKPAELARDEAFWREVAGYYSTLR